MLTEAALQTIFAKLPHCTIGVLGDLFLDRYLEIDAALTEPSLETGLDAYQVVRLRASPGAAGTVLNNLAALGVGRICPISLIGDDGEGYELRQALTKMPSVDTRGLIQDPERRTPTYTKPMLHETGKPARELNRLDIKNRRPPSSAMQDAIEAALAAAWGQVQALVVLDQVSEEDCGVIGERMRRFLAKRAAADPDKFVLADSRERIGLFSNVRLKPNRDECLKAAPAPSIEQAVRDLARRAARPVYCTCGADGILLGRGEELLQVPGYLVSGPIDIVGAGDSSSAAIACAVACGLSEPEAAAFGNLVASITIQQIGTTGTASPEQVWKAWRCHHPWTTND
jgi:bifunctional ADP-heptose synthase (sugar kinase/adenylyltransferase)